MQFDDGRNLVFDEDTHFHIDHAPPEEVIHVLKVLSIDRPVTTAEIADLLSNVYGFEMQKDKTYSPRRLFDLGLAKQARLKGKSGISYTLSEDGLRLQRILDTDAALAHDIIHFLHFSGYKGKPTDRKLFWSYRKCCELIGTTGHIPTSKDMASSIQIEIQESFPGFEFNTKQGFRFNSGSATEVTSWLKTLEPSPIDSDSKRITPRNVMHFELALLSLNDLYVENAYTYGDPVLLDNELIRRLCRPFFLSEDCFYDLLKTASMVSPFVRFSDTLAGPSVKLLKPFEISSI